MLKKLSFEDLILWQRAHDAVLRTYQYTTRLPPKEAEGLRSELRTSTRTIASHIAEGHEATNPGRRMQFLCYAQEALKRARYLYILSVDLSYGTDSKLKELLDEVEVLLIDFMSLTRNNLRLNFSDQVETA